MYIFQNHTADLKIKIESDSFESIFQESLNALKEYYHPSLLNEKFTKEITIDSFDKKTLLVDFLNEIIFLINSEKIFPEKVKVLSLKENKGEFLLEGKKYDKIYKDIKAATYHNLKFEEEKEKITVEIVFDI